MIFNIEQNTPEWHRLRLGRFTASVCADLMMDEKTKGYQKLIDKIIEEMHTGQPTESDLFKGNVFTERGNELEQEAIQDYEFLTGESVERVGFIALSDWEGCSPDGLIGQDGLIQIKNPIFNTQRKYWKIYNEHKDLTDNEILQKIEKRYFLQTQFELYVTIREYNIFYSYHPKLAPIMLKIVRDEPLITEIKNKIIKAKEYIEQELKELRSLW